MNKEKTQIADWVASKLNAELGLLKDIINRVADELNLPTENGNRVHDVLFWLDSPKPIDYTNSIVFKKVNVEWQKTAPTEAGEWYMRCWEANYALELVDVKLKDGELWAIDCDIGSLPVAMYHDGLTDCLWCKT